MKLNTELKKTATNELAIEISSKADYLCEQLEAMKVQLIENHCNLTKEEAVAYNSRNETIRDLKPAKLYTPGVKNNSPFSDLKAKIQEFNNIYRKILTDSLNKEGVKISPLLDTKVKYKEHLGKSLSWEKALFWNIPPAEVLNTLSLIQLNIRFAENIALSSLINSLKNK